MNVDSNMLANLQKVYESRAPRKSNLEQHQTTEKVVTFDKYFQDTIQAKQQEIEAKQQIIEAQQKVQFSKHANERLLKRDITLTSEQMSRIETGVNKAKFKGINDSLVIVDNIALVVNVKNKMVITALDKSSGDNIFTNIDGAVIV